jgi:hypothetical protein
MNMWTYAAGTDYFFEAGIMLTTLFGANFTVPSTSANNPSSFALPTLRPALKGVPRCFNMMVPAFTTWPPPRFTPNDLG